MKRILMYFTFLLLAVGSPAQSGFILIQFHPLFNGEALLVGKKYPGTNKKDSISIDLLKFYVSGIEFLSKGVVVEKETNSYHLIDISDPASLSIRCRVDHAITFDEVKFNLGIDSTTNVSGVMGGDLDPTKGMYWTWQSGYINLKIEGTCGESTASKHEFQFHLGGYATPVATLQMVSIPVKSSDIIEIGVNADRFFSGVNMANENHVMSPGKDSVRLSGNALNMFSLYR